MWSLLLLPLAHAGADQPFARVDDRITVRWYAGIDGDGPVRPYWRRASASDYRAWTFPDGTAEHVEIYAQGVLETETRYDASGRPQTTVRFGEDGVPVGVVVHSRGDEAFETAAWTTTTHLGATLRTPVATAVGDDGVLTAQGPDWTFSVTRADKADPFSDAYRDGLARGCACVLEDRGTAWADGKVGARYRVAFPHPVRRRTGEVWAFPAGDEVILVSFVTDRTDTAGTALGRALIALWRWEGR